MNVILEKRDCILQSLLFVNGDRIHPCTMYKEDMVMINRFDSNSES